MLDYKYTREELQTMLRTGTYTVTFTKVNGDQRSMPCTLLESYIPESEKPKGTKTLSPKQMENLSVYSLESQAWRSFKIDNVIKVEPYVQENVTKDEDSYIVKLVEDSNGETLLTIPHEVSAQLELKFGDTINFDVKDNGSVHLSK